jgi:hypothetical protein
MEAAYDNMFAKAKTAYFLLHRKCNVMDIHNVFIKIKLFDALIRPILNFGCEVWGPSSLCCKHINDMNNALTNLGCATQLNGTDPVDVDMIVQEAVDKWKSSPITAPFMVRNIPNDLHTGFKSIKYYKWFALQEPTKNFVPFLHRMEQISAVAQFRMCAHWLNCEKRKDMDGNPVPRSSRICQLCSSHTCEDEMHIFDCTFYTDIRSRFNRIFPNARGFMASSSSSQDEDFRTFVNGDGPPTFWSR